MSKRQRARHKHPSHASRRRRNRMSNVARSRVNVIAEAGEPPRAQITERDRRRALAVTSDPTPIVPEAVRRRFIAARNIYSLPGGRQAFVDRGDRLTTRRETAEVIKSLAAIAQARGWREVSLEGTARFKRRMWLAARLAGLSVRGQSPDPRAQAELTRALARRPERASQLPLSLPHAAPPQEPPVPPTPSLPPRPTPGPREWRGRLIEHGAAPYRHDPTHETSYFVKLQTGSGERDIWGIDLKRALRASSSHPVPGDEVVLRRVEHDAVRGDAAERDQMRTLGKELPRPRNRYVIETAAFFEARAELARAVRDTSVSAREATHRHPALLGAYLGLRAAQLAAPRLEHTEDQRQFVGLIRRALVTSIAHGEPLPQLRMRARASMRDDRQDRSARAAEPFRE
jgi:hypothetical protein